jgi:hypothetical protein
VVGMPLIADADELIAKLAVMDNLFDYYRFDDTHDAIGEEYWQLPNPEELGAMVKASIPRWTSVCFFGDRFMCSDDYGAFYCDQ